MCDIILYVHQDDTDDRFIRTKPTKNINAGDRTGRLPEIMPLDFKLIKECLENKNEKR